ncbi:MAG: outer membrane protein assembly factor BamD [Acidobacteria bacterium]|nr:outer membrane protein assembly factor BamD [Acidobacteriota bacterium]
MLKIKFLLPYSLLAILLFALAGCGSKDKVKNENAVIPGRDKELYEQASKKAEKGRYDEARLLYNVVITTYADSEYLPLAKLAIADTFYLEGGTSNLEQAIGGYKEFASYFPSHPRVCDVKHKIAHSLMRQMGAYNRDASKAKQAEFQLKAALSNCQVSALKPMIENDLRDVQQVLGLHELDIARFYIKNRQAYKAGESRLRDIINQYPFFSYYDESLYLLGLSLIEQEQPEEASEYFTRLLRDYPNSEFSKNGKDYLEKLGKPIPEPAHDKPAPGRPGMVGKFTLILGYNGLDVSKDGVLLSKKGEEKQDVKDTMKPAEASGGGGTRAVRASTKVNLDNSAVNQTSGNATNAAPAQVPAAQNGNSRARTTNGNNQQPSAPEANGGEAKSGDEKKNGSKKEKDPKKKKGFFGSIFR